jgi:hypothetical protein
MPRGERAKRVVAAGAVLDDGAVVELVHDPEQRTTGFVVGRDRDWRLEKEVTLPDDALLCPYSPSNNLLTHSVVALPSGVGDFGDEAELVERVREFVHRYVDLPAEFEELAARYVLFTWVYDDFSEVPYLRVRGDYGTGKSRFLLAVGLLCYRATFASGASSVASLFRVMDAFRGTLLLDEGDFRFSDEKAEVTKILNNGHARGFPVLRTEQSGSTKEFSPRAFTVFGPKIIATRDVFQDRALESRCLTEVLHPKPMRSDIPLNLDDDFRNGARELRNCLLAFRLRTKGAQRKAAGAMVDGAEPRTRQILYPLLATIGDESAARRVEAYCRRIVDADKEERREASVEARVLEALLAVAAGQQRVAIKDVAAEFSRRHAEEEGWCATPRWIGSILRRKLYLRTMKSQGNFILPPSELSRLPDLALRYGISSQVDVGDVVDVDGEGASAPARPENAEPGAE